MIDLFNILIVNAGEIPALSGSIFQFGADHVTALVANASSLIESFFPVVLVLAGLSLGFSIVLVIISIFDTKESKKRSRRIEKALSETDRLLS